MVCEMEFERACNTEVIRIHAFFVDWLTGRYPNSSEIFWKGCGKAFSKDLVLINPSGEVSRNGDLRYELQKAYGNLEGSNFNMKIRNFQVLQSHPDWCLTMYEKWHYHGSITTARQCTALFRPNPSAPNGVEWVHIHETWSCRRAEN
mmetsp:Transcript_1270/g.2281  ORF Transcript_1270/g.2281 Transcript_1270/m.2281 type:complete len:147 (-) Transcript_1270:312-752(-)